MAKLTPPHRGARLFSEPESEAKPAAPPAWRANIDGGSRGNPGPAAYGVVIRDPRGEIVARLKKYIGRTTNNVAEYYGLIAALDYAQSNHVRALNVESDSELLVKQLRGQYKVKSGGLKPLFERAKKMSQSFASFRVTHVYREHNREADALANQAMDEVSGPESRNSNSETRNSKTAARDATGAVRPNFFNGKLLTGQDLGNEQSYQLKQRPIRARFRSGVLYLLEDVDLPDGAEVEILIKPFAKS